MKGLMPQMKLGWWRDRRNREQKIVRYDNDGAPWCWIGECGSSWEDGGKFNSAYGDSPYDLIEFIRPLEDLPHALNSAVKAAEDRVRAWKTHHAAAQKLADEALEILEEAKRELERLEKECEVNVTNAAKVGDHGQGFMPAIKKCEVKP